MYVDFTKDKDLEYRWNWPMLTLKLQAKDYELTLLSHKLKSDPFPKKSQDQRLFQAEHFRPNSCLILYFISNDNLKRDCHGYSGR